MSEQISRAGIIDGVTARRKNDGNEVVSLGVKVRFDTYLNKTYNYGEQKTEVDEVMFSMPPNSNVNPGDVVVMTLDFKSPFGQRFVPALTMSDENPADVLDEDMLADEANDEENANV